MKLTRKELRKLIQESTEPYDPVRVKTVDPEDFAPVGHPVPRFEKPRSEEIPLYRNGRFFVAKHPKDTRRGYAYPNKFYSFYMMPIGSDEALLIPSIEGNLSLHRITSVNNAKKYIDWLAMKTDGMDDMSQIIQVIIDTPKEISHHPKHMPANIREAAGFRSEELDMFVDEFVDGSYGMRGRTVPMSAIINEKDLDEAAPPGEKWEKRVKALKGKVDNPYAVAWAEYNEK